MLSGYSLFSLLSSEAVALSAQNWAEPDDHAEADALAIEKLTDML
jgi:hypothetical protein